MSPDYPIEIDVQQVKVLLDEGVGVVLLDCREPDEHQAARIDQAQLIPMGELPRRIAELADHRDRRVIVVCHLGGRSLRVAHWLRTQGFQQAQSMDGGIDAWAQLIDRSVPRY